MVKFASGVIDLVDAINRIAYVDRVFGPEFDPPADPDALAKAASRWGVTLMSAWLVGDRSQHFGPLTWITIEGYRRRLESAMEYQAGSETLGSNE